MNLDFFMTGVILRERTRVRMIIDFSHLFIYLLWNQWNQWNRVFAEPPHYTLFFARGVVPRVTPPLVFNYTPDYVIFNGGGIIVFRWNRYEKLELVPFDFSRLILNPQQIKTLKPPKLQHEKWNQKTEKKPICRFISKKGLFLFRV